MMRRWIGATVLTCCSLSLLGQTSSTSTLHVKKFIAPAYPTLARGGRFEGSTTSEVRVRADGTVDSVEVVSAHPLFRLNVEQALRQWVFEPTGDPASLKVTVKFSLTEGCDKIPDDSVIETRVIANLPDTVFVNTCTEPIVTTSW
jgi:TonB family protein